MTRTILAALVAALPLSAAAQGVFVPPPSGVAAGTQLPPNDPRAQIRRDLPRYGYGGVDTSRLTLSQAAHIRFLIQSGRPEGDIRGQIGAVLRRGPLQRGLDRVIR